MRIREETARFYTGDAVVYRDATPEWLLKRTFALGPVDAERRSLAAAGIVRSLLDVPAEDRDEAHSKTLSWAMHLLWSARNDYSLTYARTKGHLKDVPPLLAELPPVNATLDSVTVTATRANQPGQMAELLNTHVPEGKQALVIALGHGGIISAADTFAAGAGRIFHPARFSRHKHKDKKPLLGDREIEQLQTVASVSPVVILDEDYDFMNQGTLREAMKYFGNLFEKEVFGASPVMGRHPNGFDPILMSSESGRIKLPEDEPELGNGGVQTVGDLLDAPSYHRYWSRNRD